MGQVRYHTLLRRVIHSWLNHVGILSLVRKIVNLLTFLDSRLSSKSQYIKTWVLPIPAILIQQFSTDQRHFYLISMLSTSLYGLLKILGMNILFHPLSLPKLQVLISIILCHCMLFPLLERKIRFQLQPIYLWLKRPIVNIGLPRKLLEITGQGLLGQMPPDIRRLPFIHRVYPLYIQLWLFIMGLRKTALVDVAWLVRVKFQPFLLLRQYGLV